MFTKRQAGILGVLGLAVLLVLCFGGYLVIKDEMALWTPTFTPTHTPSWLKYVKTPAPASGPGDKYMASQYCKEAIREQLLVPKSADFDADRSPDRWYEEGFYYVAGKVEASNAYGVMVPYQYYCEVQYSGGHYIVVVADLF